MQKKFHRRCSTGLKISFWLRLWNIELTLVPSVQIKLRKYSAAKYVWHRFWKGKRSWWESKENDCFCRSSRPKDYLKKLLGEVSQNSQENMCRNLFFDKVKFCRSATSLKTSPYHRCFLMNFAKFIRTPFFGITPDDCFWS